MNKILTAHQKDFLEYILNKHLGYGYTLLLQSIVDNMSYNRHEKNGVLNTILKIHANFLKGKDYKNEYIFNIDVYGKPTRFLKWNSHKNRKRG